MSSNAKSNRDSQAIVIELEDAPAPKPAATPSATAPLRPVPAPEPIPPSAPARRSPGPASRPIPKRPVSPAPAATVYGGFWIRACALLIDASIQLIVLGILNKAQDKPFSSLFCLAYFAFWPASPLRATPGKLALGLQVQRGDGEPLSLARSIVRTLSTFLSSLILSLGYVMAAFSDKKQALHDRIAGTVVVRTREVKLSHAFGMAFLAFVVLYKASSLFGITGLKGKLYSPQGLKPLSELTDDPCTGKQYCVITYVTPWCPACKASEPLMLQLRDYLNAKPKIGFKTIVGQDELPKLEAEARIFGDTTLLDTDGKFAQRMGINSFPTWLVIRSRDNQVIAQPDSITTSRPLTPAELEEFAPKHLQLDPRDFRD